MSTSLRRFQDDHADGTSIDVEAMLKAWQEDLDAAEDKLEVCRQEVEDANTLAAAPPDYGTCRRGCSPAYLDREGFCSPACKLGAPRGQYVTITDHNVQVAHA